MDRGALQSAIYVVARVEHDLETKPPQPPGEEVRIPSIHLRLVVKKKCLFNYLLAFSAPLFFPWCFLLSVILFIFRPCHVACEILAPRPGIELMPPALGTWRLSHWPAKEILNIYISLEFVSRAEYH